MGVVRTAPSLIASAPVSLGGFGLLSFEVEQLSQHLSLLMLHGPHRQSATSSLLRASLEYLAIETGFSGDPLSLPTVTYTKKHTWASQTIESLRKFNIKMTSDINPLCSWCENDICIMEALQARVPTNTSFRFVDGRWTPLR
jgi:hypothetical protein